MNLDNIMLDFNGHIKLVDFALAKENVTGTTEGASTICGSLSYIAPELISCSSYGTNVDWWSLGTYI